MRELDLVGSAEACRILNRDKATLTRWVKAGRIAPVMRAGGHQNSAFVFERADVERLALDLEGSDAPAPASAAYPLPVQATVGHAVECSRCGAPAGRDCVTAGGSRAFPAHHVRAQAERDLDDRQAARLAVAR